MMLLHSALYLCTIAAHSCSHTRRCLGPASSVPGHVSLAISDNCGHGPHSSSHILVDNRERCLQMQTRTKSLFSTMKKLLRLGHAG